MAIRSDSGLCTLSHRAQRCHKPETGAFDAMPRHTTKASAAIWRVVGHGSNCRVTLKHAGGRRGGRRRQARLSSIARAVVTPFEAGQCPTRTHRFLGRVTRPVLSSASQRLTERADTQSQLWVPMLKPISQVGPRCSRPGRTGRCARDNRGCDVRPQWLAGNGHEYSDNNGALEQIKLSDPRKLADELARGMRDDTTLG
ncbi:predicted protein [Verticillium alfalfae VaMs.102]|uniref:Predicted protein n=1 Tax=Verticillium alfalfae (strain VaMs.102 / ATCC MYA-4576 / FGSC 10136) TaxID=526221 RepID=C9SVP7_VERA1|nr:predicted protein [Verticillium alfalfae VaMs.102]EEY22862.1 predicted protein [Verticillium alfalfae VaMs.102]